MFYISNFEIFVSALKSKYESDTGANFYEDFGNDSLIQLKKVYESGASQDLAIKEFINKNKLNRRCCCETGSVF